MSDRPLPKGWTTVRVGDLVGLDNGFAFKPSHWKKAGLPIIRIQNLNNPDAAFNYCTDEVPARCHVEPNDLLFAWSGTPGTSFGAHIWRGEKAVLNQHIFNVRFDDKATDRRFLRLAINQNLDEYIRVAHGGAGLAHITKGRFEESSLLMPPLPEQRRIVARIEELFSDLDAGVSALERVRANLKRYRAAVLKAAVEGRLTEEWRKQHPATEPATKLLERILAERRAKWEQDQLRKFKEAGKTPPKGWKEKYREAASPNPSTQEVLPRGWVTTTTDAMLSFVTSGSRGWAEHYSDDGALFIRVGNLNRMSIDLDFRKLQRVTPPDSAESARTVLAGGDLLISVTADIGMVAVTPDDIGEAYVNQHIALARPLTTINKSFLAWYLATDHGGQAQWKRLQRGATKLGLGLDDIRHVTVPLPPLAEQAEIVAEVDRRLSVADAAETQVEHALQRAARLRQAILKRAFEGKLVPQEVEQDAEVTPDGYLFNALPDLSPLLAVAAMYVSTLSESRRAGRIKLVKFLYLTQAHLGVDLGCHWKREAAGPLDRSVYEIEKHAERIGVFSVDERPAGGAQYVPGPQLSMELQNARQLLGARFADAERLLEKLRPINKEGTELIATVHAAWNDLLLDGRPDDDDAIVAEVRGWHESKERFSPEQIRGWISWLRLNSIIPRGTGNRTIPLVQTGPSSPMSRRRQARALEAGQ